MKKKIFTLLLSGVLVFGMLSGCKDDAPTVSSEDSSGELVSIEVESEPESLVEIIPDNSYRSELTNEWIDESLQNQRPIAVMVDNEKTALDHYGLTQADIVYEMMNSTANDEVTRFMALVKDWDSITRFGSIRSVRPTNFMIAPEYNAIVVHDGGPFYIDAYLNNPWVDNLSGGFARIENGKPREFTEYVTTGEIASRIEAANYDTEYNEYYKGPHWKFANPTDPVDLSETYNSKECTLVDLPFPHNGSELEYDEETGKYLYYEYGMAHIDPENDNAQLSFTNVVLQCADITQYDANGYMQFNILNESGSGYYITGGHAIPITWEKAWDTDPTKFYDSNGNEIVLNTGKTYIGLVSSTRWSELILK